MHDHVELNKQGLNSKHFQRKLRVANKSETKLNSKTKSSPQENQIRERSLLLQNALCVHARVHVCGSCGYGIGGR